MDKINDLVTLEEAAPVHAFSLDDVANEAKVAVREFHGKIHRLVERAARLGYGPSVVSAIIDSEQQRIAQETEALAKPSQGSA